MNSVRKSINKLFRDIRVSYCLIALAGSIILAFGLYNIHAQSEVTEGGVLGLTLLLDYWFHISPSVSSFILNAACYLFAWKLLGRTFVVYSAVSTAGFSLSYWIFEQFPPLFPKIAANPLLAALVGSVFVGVGAGLCVRAGGAPGGDDALAMALEKLTHWKIQWLYLFSDLAVLLLSLTYIPFRRIFYSLLTVILSGQIIGLVMKLPLPGGKKSRELPAQE